MPRHIVVAKIDQGKLIVTQANKLAEASYSMTLEEKRVVLLIVSLVRKEDGDFKTYRIPITDIRDYLALRSNKLYDDIKRIAEALMSRVLHIQSQANLLAAQDTPTARALAGAPRETAIIEETRKPKPRRRKVKPAPWWRYIFVN
jgi:hypothetical protein